MSKIQTLAEMEAESLDGFRNPVLSQEEEQKLQKAIADKMLDEKARAHRFTLTQEEITAQEKENEEDSEDQDVDGN